MLYFWWLNLVVTDSTGWLLSLSTTCFWVLSLIYTWIFFVNLVVIVNCYAKFINNSYFLISWYHLLFIIFLLVSGAVFILIKKFYLNIFRRRCSFWVLIWLFCSWTSRLQLRNLHCVVRVYQAFLIEWTLLKLVLLRRYILKLVFWSQLLNFAYFKHIKI